MKLTGTYPVVEFVDKFPRYLQHIIPPKNTRILDTSRVRFGAQLAPGTTVMPGASYINFNAGTLGVAMVEGRISSSAIVGAETDVGGGASILGLLSGGNSTPITIGKKCLLGANSVTGIPLGDGCIVDAGATVLAGTRVFMSDDTLAALNAVNPERDIAAQSIKSQNSLREFKASALSGCNGLHFRVDSETGRMTVKRSRRKVLLNADLH
jgi:2,3,4,5-tetrahydropyridine-2-carboxylate N-succinyltransferase